MVKGIMSFITVDNLNVINVELTNYCNAACPMCLRFDWDLNLVEGVTNTKHTTLKLIEEKIGKKIISKFSISQMKMMKSKKIKLEKNLI